MAALLAEAPKIDKRAPVDSMLPGGSQPGSSRFDPDFSSALLRDVARVPRPGRAQTNVGRRLPAGYVIFSRMPSSREPSDVRSADPQPVARGARPAQLPAPVHGARRSSRERAARDRRRRGRVAARSGRATLLRRHGRPVVRGHRLRPSRGRRSDLPAGKEAQLLPRLLVDGDGAVDPPRRPADPARARRHEQGVLRQLRLRCQRHQGQAGLVLQQPARQAGEGEDHLAPERLSRRHGGRRQPDRAAAAAQGVAPADSRGQAHGVPRRLPRQARGHVRAGLLRSSLAAELER